MSQGNLFRKSTDKISEGGASKDSSEKSVSQVSANIGENTQASQPQVYSVSQINSYVKRIIEGRFSLVWMKGEISNFKPHSSGHFYFSLKDSKSQMNAVMFRGHNRLLKFKPKNGDEVIVRGRLTVYEPRGNYQIFCETMEPVGAGELQRKFEELKAKLKSEGLFEAEHKKEIPTLPKHVALITSPTGAAVKDMLNVLERRFKGLEITIIPCKVQGDQAPREIKAAIEKIPLLNKKHPVDVVVCGRGGGSIEDLWAFNDESLARAIFACETPIVSAVGHEIDFTIADFVADLRAPTPSAAAELVVKNTAEISDRILQMKNRMSHQMRQLLESHRRNIQSLTRQLVDPKKYLQDLSMRCDDLFDRLEQATTRYFSDRRIQIEMLTRKFVRPDEKLKSLSLRIESCEQR